MPSSAMTRCPLRGGCGIWKRNGLLRRQRFFDQLHALDLLELAHRLRRLRRDLAEAIVEFAQRRDFLLLVFVGGVLLLVALVALLEEGGVVARVGDQLALGDFVNALDDFIHELRGRAR